MGEVLVVGCGFVGTRLARRLAADHEVTAVTRSGVDITDVTSLRADVTDPDLELPETDTLFYLVSAGGRTAEDYRRSFVDGLANVRDAAPGADLVYASSTAVYGDAGGAWVDEATPVDPDRPRDRVQVEAEDLARDAGGTVVRLAGLYGPGRVPSRRYLGDVDVPRGHVNLIHRDDAASALAHAAFEGGYDLYVGVDDEPADRHELARWLADRTGRPAGRLLEERKRPDKRVSNERLRSEGWRPTYPTFREGVAPLL